MSSGFDAWAETYTHEPNPLRALAARILRAWIAEARPNERFLDAGCGPAPALPHALGLDLSREMLRRGPRGRIVLADFLAAPFPPRSFAWVFASLTLSYTTDPAAALARLVELVRPGGRLIVCDLHPQAADWRRGPGLDSRAGKLAAALHPPASWTEVDRVEARFGEAEKPLFEAAGRMDLWERTLERKALLAVRWEASQ